MPTEKALAILQEGVADGKFDGKIVNALVNYLDKTSSQSHTSV